LFGATAKLDHRPLELAAARDIFQRFVLEAHELPPLKVFALQAIAHPLRSLSSIAEAKFLEPAELASAIGQGKMGDSILPAVGRPSVGHDGCCARTE